LICLLADFIVYNGSYFYYESQGLLLLFTGAQALLTAIPAFLIRRISRK
jgi:hypothetical protein